MIKRISLTNFRKYKDFNLNFDKSLNVLIGNNASGKTTILDGIAKLLNQYCINFDNSQQSGLPAKFPISLANRSTIEGSDIRDVFYEKSVEKQFPLCLKLEGELLNKDLSWDIKVEEKTNNETIKIPNSKLKNVINSTKTKVQNGEKFILPVIAYYGTGRLNLASEEIAFKKIGSRLDGYFNSLEPNIDRQSFMSLFKTLTHDYILSIEKGGEYPTELKVITDVIKKCIPDCSDFSYSARYDTILITYLNGNTERFSSLSDGYKNIISIVTDIAYRAVTLNGFLNEDSIKKSPGIVLIDEIDQHLHPKWQIKIIDDLKNAFPNIQFIVTTHSPFIIQSIRHGILYDLDNNKITSSDTYIDKSIEDITEEIQYLNMPQKSKRFKDMMNVATQYYKLLSENPTKIDSSELKEQLDTLLIPYSDNPAYAALLKLKAEQFRSGGKLETSK